MTTAPEIDAPKVDSQLFADLRLAREIIASGWTRGIYRDTAGNVCVLGAVLSAKYGHPAEAVSGGMLKTPRTQRVLDELVETLGADPRPGLEWRALADFNDDDSTVHEDVIGLFDATIRRLSE